MRSIMTLFILALIPGFVYSQTLKPGVAYARIPELHINGFKIGNTFSFPMSWVNMDIGIDFILGRGNPNVVYSDSMNYNLELLKIEDQDWYTTGLVPFTTSTTQFNASLGISRRFSKWASDLSLGFGGYISRTSSHFLIGPFKETDVFFTILYTTGSPAYIADPIKKDFMFPVSLRYLNAGIYLGAEWLLLKDKPAPVGIEFKYYAGLTRKHIITFGINFHLPVKSNAV
jgi:hypothetical protein